MFDHSGCPRGWLKEHMSRQKVIELVDGVCRDVRIAAQFGWVGWKEPYFWAQRSFCSVAAANAAAAFGFAAANAAAAAVNAAVAAAPAQ